MQIDSASLHAKRFYKYVHWMQTVESVVHPRTIVMWIAQMQMNRFESGRPLLYFYNFFIFYLFCIEICIDADLIKHLWILIFIFSQF